MELTAATHLDASKLVCFLMKILEHCACAQGCSFSMPDELWTLSTYVEVGQCLYVEAHAESGLAT